MCVCVCVCVCVRVFEVCVCARVRAPPQVCDARARGGAMETPSAPITVRKNVTDIPNLIRLTASDQPGH